VGAAHRLGRDYGGRAGGLPVALHQMDSRTGWKDEVTARSIAATPRADNSAAQLNEQSTFPCFTPSIECPVAFMLWGGTHSREASSRHQGDVVHIQLRQRDGCHLIVHGEGCPVFRTKYRSTTSLSTLLYGKESRRKLKMRRAGHYSCESHNLCRFSGHSTQSSHGGTRAKRSSSMGGGG